MNVWLTVTRWDPRRRLTAVAGALATLLVVAVPTAMIPNPVFGRDVGVTWWSWPVLLATAALSGLLLATYVRADIPSDPTVSRRGAAGGLLTFFAVGCPVCNKLVLVLLGYAGALQWFAPVQPLLAVAAVGLLVWAVRARLAGEVACPVPAP